VSSVGAFVDRYESDLAALTGVRRAVAVVNGTAALHMCLLLAGVEREDEVLMPTLTFVATANAVVYCGAVPHLVDSDASTLGVDPEKLRAYMESLVERRSDLAFNKLTGRRIRALVVMHTFGHPADLESLSRVCGDFGLVLIEDAAESLGSFYKGRPTGNWGLLSAVSFNGNKIVTAGGGGAILTNNVELGDLAKHLTTTARRPHRWEFVHDAVGYNYRLPNINAALGCAQLEQLPESVTRKRALAVRYRDAFASISGASFFLEPEDCCSNYWLNALLIDPELANQRDRVLAASNEAGFMTRPVWSLMHRLPMYAACPRMNLDVAESLASRVVNLPSSAFL
jgi:perosamine synthetase